MSALKKYLQEKGADTETLKKAVLTARELRRKNTEAGQADNIQLETWRQTLADLNLTEEEYVEALRRNEADEQKRLKRLKKTGTAAGVILAGLVVFSWTLKNNATDRLIPVKAAWDEVLLQEERGKQVILNLQALLDGRENAKLDKYKIMLKESGLRPAKVSEIVGALSALLNDEAFLKIMDETTGSINRLTVARRRYSQVYNNYIASAGAMDGFFVDAPPKPDWKARLLKTGH